MPDFTVVGSIATIHNEELYSTWENRLDYQAALTETGSPELVDAKRTLMRFEAEFAKMVRGKRIHEDIDRVLGTYIGDGYLQHDPNLENGREALAEDFRSAPEVAAPPIPIGFVAEGDLIGMILLTRVPDPSVPDSLYDFFVPTVFRVQEGNLVEHWFGREKIPGHR